MPEDRNLFRGVMNWLTKGAYGAPDRRRAFRASEPNVAVYYWDGSAPASHQLRDVSLTGAYLYTSERWYPGTIIRLLLQEPEPGADADTAADVDTKAAGVSASILARVVRHGSDGMALEFVFRDPADRERLALLMGAQSQIPPVGNTLRAGQAVVELALMVPLIFLLIVNAVNFGAFLFDWITIANAARAGVQYWSVGSAAIGTPASATAAQVTALVTNDISSLLSRSTLVVRSCKNNNSAVTCSGSGSAVPPADPESLSYISASVDVTYTYTPPIPLWNFSGLGIHATLPPTTIHRQAVMRMLQ